MSLSSAVNYLMDHPKEIQTKERVMEVTDVASLMMRVAELEAENAKLKEDLANRTRQLSEVVLKLREYQAMEREAGQDWGGT